MFLFYLFILVPLITARRFDGPSYRSSVMDGDKPILRIAANAESDLSGSDDEDRQAGPPPNAEGAKMVRDLGLLIEWLVENFGYDLVPQGRKNNDDVADIVSPRIKIPAPHPHKEEPPKPQETKKYSLNYQAIKPSAIRTRHKDELNPAQPYWVSDLKEFIKDLTTRFGQQDIDQYTKPVIASLEKKHNVKIKDIDGEILISYIQRETSKKKKKPEPKALRYRTAYDKQTKDN